MPDSTLLERLQPYLLDRLTDDEPDAQQESRDRRGISMRRYRDGVLRDLTWLLNATPYPFDQEMEGSEDLASSVLNFGFRDLCGLTASSLSIPDIERELVRAIQRFEPRIIRNTLSVRVVADPKSAGNHIGFEIKGDLWAMPKPEYLDIKTEIDLETGKCEFRAQEGGQTVTKILSKGTPASS
jgi:type VI secretion system protein ImpF